MDPKLAALTLEVAHRTDPGRDPEKQVNEDSCGDKETPFGRLCVVCDGMGGHEHGREASTLALATIFETFEAKPPGSSAAPGSSPQPPGPAGRALLREAVLAANRRVHELGGQATAKQRPGSTVVAILAHTGGAEVAHVGDSRCYLIQAGQIFQVTKDHTLVQELVDAKVLTPEQAAVHPDANQILRALGASPELDVDVRPQTLAYGAGDTFVLCSDGLSDLVPQADILRVVTSAPPAQAASQLVDLANSRGGHDNITALVARARSDAPVENASGEPSRPPAPTLAQTLFETPAMPAMQPPPAPVPAAGSNLAETMAEAPHPKALQATAPLLPAPPAVSSGPQLPRAEPPPPARRGLSLAVVLGIALAAVGFAAAGFVIYMLVHPQAKAVAPFALGLPLTTAAPIQSLVPVAPDSPPPPLVDGGPVPGPLPSLTPPPSKTLRHGHGS
jgi:serine/threonine protein phosphatase PrpC